MEIESLFSSTRWEILQAISEEKLSPMELAEKVNTTSANVSQQLRLLELAGLVRSEKTSNVEKGKPRIVYSLAGDMAFLILSSTGFTDKKLVTLSPFHSFMLKSWFLDNKEHHYLLAEIYLSLREKLKDIDAIAVESSTKELVLHILSEKKVSFSFESKKVRVVLSNIGDFKKKMPEDYVMLYDPYEQIQRGVKNE